MRPRQVQMSYYDKSREELVQMLCEADADFERLASNAEALREAIGWVVNSISGGECRLVDGGSMHKRLLSVLEGHQP